MKPTKVFYLPESCQQKGVEASQVTLWKDAPGGGVFNLILDRKYVSLMHSVTTSCFLSMLTGDIVGSCDPVTVGSLLFRGKVMIIVCL